MTRPTTETQVIDIQRQLNEAEMVLETTLEALTRASRELEEQRARRDALRLQLQELESQSVQAGEVVGANDKKEQAEQEIGKEQAGGGPALASGVATGAVQEITHEQRLSQLNHRKLLQESELFDAGWYLATYPDVKQVKKYSLSPHEHYLMYGGFEGRNPGPTFDSAFYLAQYPDVAASQTNPLVHYLLYGHKEGRQIARGQSRA
ncbi:hypothetical protein IOC61_03240 [Halomonas sp. KAO]|uniref:hypothetical protein n=1 Tax=Halomonas sp. KAO TaxID=2783858 RepID=UPI0018A0AA31|nr:hypothetical protein [Halomonas sp. KAO]MBF7052330.1 hypothetical protein [Halomonas sp. KAO]